MSLDSDYHVEQTAVTHVTLDKKTDLLTVINVAPSNVTLPLAADCKGDKAKKIVINDITSTSALSFLAAGSDTIVGISGSGAGDGAALESDGYSKWFIVRGSSGVGATVSEAELVTADNVTGNATASKHGYMPKLTPGVATASAPVTLGASKNLDVFGLPVGGLKIGVAGAETPITPTAAELNTLAGITASVAELNLTDGAVVANSVASILAMLDANKRLQTNSNNGTPGANCTAVHYGDGVNVTAVITLTNAVIVVGDSANLGVGYLVYTLPSGACLIRDSYFSIVLSGITTGTDTPDTGLGTVIATGAVTVLDGTGTFEDVSTGVAMTNPNSTPTVAAAGPTAGNPLAIPAGAAHTVHLNMAGAWSANADKSGLLNGTVVISYIRQAA